ncbi:methyltransferase [Gluconobacter wancherniae]|uniref:methyltransferase n=1 Tax=Gluconobacter wancherniae TaxID=1307955 RepID=UPI003099F312
MPRIEERKHRIAARFGAAESYEAAAKIQRVCADQLAERICAAFQTPPRSILEFGCGTGFLTTRLATHFPTAHLCATDLAPGMIERIRARLPDVASEFRVMDAENPDRDFTTPFDLIASSLCLQWFSNRQKGLERLCSLLAPGGKLMVATLLQGSLQEWRDACAVERAPCGVPDYPTLDQIRGEWPTDGIGFWESMPLVDPVAKASGFLRGMRQIGASLPREGSRPASAAALRRAMRRFDAENDSVTYQIGFGLFERNHA